MGDDKPVENDQPVWDEKKHQRYSLEEVGKHVDRTDCWIIIHDLVYDITKFLDEHPGGEEILLDCAGNVATDQFEDVGHSSDARDIMKDYLIGELNEVRTIIISLTLSHYKMRALNM